MEESCRRWWNGEYGSLMILVVVQSYDSSLFFNRKGGETGGFQGEGYVQGDQVSKVCRWEIHFGWTQEQEWTRKLLGGGETTESPHRKAPPLLPTTVCKHPGTEETSCWELLQTIFIHSGLMEDSSWSTVFFAIFFILWCATCFLLVRGLQHPDPSTTKYGVSGWWSPIASYLHIALTSDLFFNAELPEDVKTTQPHLLLQLFFIHIMYIWCIYRCVAAIKFKTILVFILKSIFI